MGHPTPIQIPIPSTLTWIGITCLPLQTVHVEQKVGLEEQKALNHMQPPIYFNIQFKLHLFTILQGATNRLITKPVIMLLQCFQFSFRLKKHVVAMTCLIILQGQQGLSHIITKVFRKQKLIPQEKEDKIKLETNQVIEMWEQTVQNL